MRPGLPRLLERDPDRLNDLLGLNRRERLRLASLVPRQVRSRVRAELRRRAEPEKPGEEERILLQCHYGNPKWRRRAWDDALREPGSGPPSLLAAILEGYLKEREEAEVLEGESAAERSTRIADRAWADTSSQLERWDELGEAEQERCVLQIFAVATIRDDITTITKGFEIAPALRDEFKNLFPSDEAKDSTPDAEPSASEKWASLAASLQNLASQVAGPPPQPEALDSITEIADQLRALTPTIQEEFAFARFDDFLESVREKLKELRSVPSIALEDAECASIEQSWEKRRGLLVGDALDEARLDFETVVAEGQRQLRAAIEKLNEATTRIASHRGAEPSTPSLMDAWEETLSDLQKAEGAFRRARRESRETFLKALRAPENDSGPSPPRPTEPLPPTDPESESDELAEADSDVVSDRDDEPDSSLEIASHKEPLPEPEREAKSVSDVEPSSPSRSESRPEPSKRGSSTKSPRKARTDPPGETESEPSGSSGPETNTPSKADSKTKTRDPLEVEAEMAMARALEQDPPRFAYAFQISRLCELVFVNEGPTRSELFEAALLAVRLRQPDGDIAIRLRDIFGTLPALDPDWSEEEEAFQVTARFAACLRPALFASYTAAYAVFRNIPKSGQFPALHDLAHKLTTNAAKLQNSPLAPTFLLAMRSHAEGGAALQGCRKEIKAWLSDAPRKTIPYQPATAVWKQWTRPEGVIGRVMSTLTQETIDAASLSSEVAQWCDSDWVKKRVAETDHRLRGSLPSSAGIRFQALQKIEHETRKAARLARKRLDLVGYSSVALDYRASVLNAFRQDLENEGPAALEQLKAVISEASVWTRVGAQLAVHAISMLRDELDPCSDQTDTRPEPRVQDLLASGIFASGFRVDPKGFPIDDPRKVLKALVEGKEFSPPELMDVHIEADDLASRDFATASRILDWYESENGESYPELRSRFSKARKNTIDELQPRIRRLLDRLETSLVLGSITADERERHQPVLVDAKRQLSDPEFLDWPKMGQELHRIDRELDESEETHLQSARTDLASLPLSPDSRQAITVERAIEERDIVRANELLARLKEDPTSSVDEPSDSKRADNFFPDQARQILAALEKLRHPAEIVRHLENGKPVAEIPADLPGARRDSAKRMLEAWFDLKRANELGTPATRNIKILFREMGFQVQNVRVTDRLKSEVTVQTVPLDRREQCPVPTYGLAAGGRYRVACLWKRPSVEDLLQYGHQSGRTGAPIILYLGRLSMAQRKELALATRKCAETLLVLDEVVVVFLCGEKGSRLPALFGSTLPFSYIQPYSDRGGDPPPEMFFGRNSEIATIRNPHGSCLVYGGRQIGKTAILSTVRRRSHDPGEERYACFVDLLTNGIGRGRPIEDVWPLLWRKLREIDAIPEEVREPSTRGSRGIEEFLETLIRHFQQGNNRSLLLLLDEADDFLDMDAPDPKDGVAAAGYLHSNRMRRLMEDTERSIKVVFAGLHNVLRTVRHENNPLAQLGTPVRVEPLLKNGEMREARSLLVRPLRAAGYRLEPDGLVMRILGQTNYYPGLIQAYGEALIGEMLSRCSGEPPYSITPDILETAYRDKKLRAHIRERFQLTLNLDKRYEVIAYSIAFLCLESEGALAIGFSRRTLQEEATPWWEDGFRDIRVEEFESLLDEMVGLGVLRRIDQNEEPAYSLRNPNVLLLMGTQADIEEKLQEPRELPPTFSPRSWRARRKPDIHGDPSRFPLTREQEGRLFKDEDGIVLISGIEAAGLSEFMDSYRSLPDRSLVVLDEVPNFEAFRSRLRSSVKRHDEGLRVHAVPLEARWTREWLGEARSYLDSLRKSNRHVRILFLSDGTRLRNLLAEPEIWKFRDLERLFLEPWRDDFLRQWMQDIEIGDSPALRERILKITGGWPEVLGKIPNLLEVHRGAEAALGELDAELSDPNEQRKWRRRLGVEGAAMLAALRPLAMYGELSIDDLLGETRQFGADPEEVQLQLRTAGHLCLAEAHEGRWKLNPFVARIIEADE